MRITSPFLQRLHLDPVHFLLTGRGVSVVKVLFDLFDCRHMSALDDVQFLAFMKSCTDLPHDRILSVFDTFDVDGSGSLEFDEFYLLICMLIAIKVCIISGYLEFI